MKRLLTMLLALLVTVTTLAEVENPAMYTARQTLEKLGYPISDAAVAMALEQHRIMQEWYTRTDMLPSDDFGSQRDWVYQLLLCQGIGEYDDDTLTWTPTSEKIYVFDAEFFNIEGMYTEFLQGVQSIMPDGMMTAVREDLSGMNEYLDGSRKVYFDYNDHSYVVTLKSDGDWLNGEIIDFLNQVLKTEGKTNRLHIVSDAWDQMVFLIYGTEADAVELRRLIGVEEPQASDQSLLDWVWNLLGK